MENKIEVKFKKLTETAIDPYRANDGDAGYDLFCDFIVYEDNYISYKTGIAVELPPNTFGLFAMRSSICNLPSGFGLRSSVGIIDNGFRGELVSKYTYPDDRNMLDSCYKVGDRIGQLIVVPFLAINFVESDTLSETSRGTGGWGSSGR